MKNRIEILREKLHEALNNGNLESVFAISRELDALILSNMKKELLAAGTVQSTNSVSTLATPSSSLLHVT